MNQSRVRNGLEEYMNGATDATVLRMMADRSAPEVENYQCNIAIYMYM